VLYHANKASGVPQTTVVLARPVEVLLLPAQRLRHVLPLVPVSLSHITTNSPIRISAVRHAPSHSLDIKTKLAFSMTVAGKCSVIDQAEQLPIDHFRMTWRARLRILT